MSRDAIHLSDFDRQADRVEIACYKCGRKGSYSVARAIDQHGDIGLPTFLTRVTADCPHKAEHGTARCHAIFPQIVRGDVKA